jgi:hypothetical protein
VICEPFEDLSVDVESQHQGTIAYATAWPCVIEISEPLFRCPISPSFLGL